ncbi:hypothetical protein KKE03_00075 [Patescibacteria group bacterium]|nr:hypothetical protein [Patescibacteria group bacterium]
MPQKLQSGFTIKFDGQLNQVDVNTLISSLMSTSAVLQEINKELAPTNKIDIKIVALSKGSFDIKYVIDTIAPLLPLLASISPKDTLENAKLIIEILAQLLHLKKIFKESEPTEVTQLKNGKVQIGTNSGNITVYQPTYNIYSRNQIANDALSKGFEALQNEPSIEELSLLDPNGGVLFDAKRDDFTGMASRRNILFGKTREEVDEDAQLFIFKLVFESNYKWEFYYKGNKISAVIQDEDFYNLIESGEKFAKGDILVAKLKINQIFEPSVDTFVNESYELLEVKEHIPRAEQQKLKV